MFIAVLKGVPQPELGRVDPEVIGDLLEQDAASAPPFDEIPTLVEREWRRRAGDRALRAYLDELRAAADVETLPELP